MSDKGYIYALINSSMPGLVKIGKTRKDPAKRAKELSRPTGVATPFQIAYKAFFNDITKAEKFIHTKLESKGYRVSNNREFFNAELTTIINIIIMTKQEFSKNYDGVENKFDLSSESEQSDELFKKGYSYYLGDEDTIQDLGKALKLFKQASKLGSLEAFQLLGSMYSEGYGVNKNFQKALDFYKEGGKRGNYLCYYELAICFMERYSIYADSDVDKANKQVEESNKCWDLFFNKGLKNLDKQFETGNFSMNAALYISTRVDTHLEIKKYEALRIKKSEIIDSMRLLKQYSDQKNVWDQAINWMENNI